MPIHKSRGTTRTETLLCTLCDNTFLNLWSYPNPCKDDGKELCDLIAVFDDHVFVFFDRESRQFDKTIDDIHLAWTRWHSKVIAKQIRAAGGAARYVQSGRTIFLDPQNNVPFPLTITPEMTIHKVIVAHGARSACQAFAEENIYGSLAVSYASNPRPIDAMHPPFLVPLDRDDIVHVLDSHNLDILLGELDTFYDLLSYIKEKERAVRTRSFLCYCGEEDLLAHYFANYDSERRAYCIGPKEGSFDGLFVAEGGWHVFLSHDAYLRRREANRISYLWDELIQKTCQNALDGTLLGNADLFKGKSALREMAREPRFTRRDLSRHIINSLKLMTSDGQTIERRLTLMPSFYKETAYVFLALRYDGVADYERDYRLMRQNLLTIACGVARNKFSHLRMVVGIAVDVPTNGVDHGGEDFVLLECENWSTEKEEYYRKANQRLKLFSKAVPVLRRVADFPIEPDSEIAMEKIGRNEPCVCGSGKKYKKCCLL